MNRGTALLVLGAILLVVFNLVGEDGAMSRLVGMDRDRIQGAVDDVGGMAATGAGLAPEVGDNAPAGQIVRPTVVGDEDYEPEELDRDSDVAADLDQAAESEEHLLRTPDQIDENNFDPRIG